MPIGWTFTLAGGLGTLALGLLLWWFPVITGAALVALGVVCVVWPWVDRRLDAILKRFTE